MSSAGVCAFIHCPDSRRGVTCPTSSLVAGPGSGILWECRWTENRGWLLPRYSKRIRLYEAPGTTKRGHFVAAAGVCAFMYRPCSRRGVTSSLQGNRGVGFFGNVDEEGIGWDSPYLYLSLRSGFKNNGCAVSICFWMLICSVNDRDDNADSTDSIKR